MSVYISNALILCKFKNKTTNIHNIIKTHKTKMSNKVPSSLKHNVWIMYVGEKFDGKCAVSWCKNRITPFTFEAGHNIPFSKGGETTIDNLRPICSDCNKSMGNRFTIDEFSEQYKSTSKNDTNLVPDKTNMIGKMFNFIFACTCPKTNNTHNMNDANK